MDLMRRRRFTGEIYKSAEGWRWRVLASNDKIVADSSEGYARHIDCKRMFRALFPLMRLRVPR